MATDLKVNWYNVLLSLMDISYLVVEWMMGGI